MGSPWPALYTVLYTEYALFLSARYFLAVLRRRAGGVGDFLLHSRGCRTTPETVRSMKSPPKECEVGEEWARVCGIGHRSLGGERNARIFYQQYLGRRAGERRM